MAKHKYIETPEKMWELFEAYRKEVKDITFKGFEHYLIDKETVSSLREYRANSGGRYDNFIDVIKLIKDEIFKNKLDLYKRGLLHHQKICREAYERNIDLSPWHGKHKIKPIIGKSNKNQFVVEDGVISVNDNLLKRKSHTAKFITNNKPPDTIYVLNIEGTNIYKIGTSQNVNRRIKDICASNPFHIDIIYLNKMLFAYEVEQSIHELLDEYHIKNEWFKIKDIDSIIKIIKNV